MHTSLIVLLASVSLTALTTICESADKPVDARQQQNPGRVQSKEARGVVSAAADVSAEAKQILGQLRGKFPRKTDDEIIHVLRGYGSDVESINGNGMGWFTKRLERARNQREALESLDDWLNRTAVYYDYEYDPAGSPSHRYDAESPAPEWLRELLGYDFFSDVAFVSTNGYHSAALFSHLSALPRLRGIRLGNSILSDSDAMRLKDAPNLEELDLRDSRVSDAGLAQIASLPQLRALHLICLPKGGVVRIGKMTKLQRLTLGSAKDADMAHLKGLMQLRELDLSSTAVGDVGLAQITGLVQLERLRINPCITDAGLKSLEGFPRLRELNLRNNAITDGGLKHLEHLSRLEELNFTWTKVGDEGMKTLGHALPQLQSLVLDATKVTDAGLAHLGHLTQLRTLDLAGTGVTDAGLAHIKELTRLQRLNLASTAVTDAGLKPLTGLTRLESLFLWDTQTTAEGVEKLQQALPNCTIFK